MLEPRVGEIWKWRYGGEHDNCYCWVIVKEHIGQQVYMCLVVHDQWEQDGDLDLDEWLFEPEDIENGRWVKVANYNGEDNG